MEELVFAFPTTELWRLIPYKEYGFIHGSTDALETIVHKGLFRDRDKLEVDPSFKQIIPYGVISCRDSFYLLRRTGGQRDKRLPDLFYLGVGGHMNPGRSAGAGEKYITDELKRELFEEVRLVNGCAIEDIEFIGFINDDTIEVGRFHIGILYNISVSNREVYINETDKMTAEWVDKSGLAEFYEGMESWSRIACDSFIKPWKH